MSSAKLQRNWGCFAVHTSGKFQEIVNKTWFFFQFPLLDRESDLGIGSLWERLSRNWKKLRRSKIMLSLWLHFERNILDSFAFMQTPVIWSAGSCAMLLGITHWCFHLMNRCFPPIFVSSRITRNASRFYWVLHILKIGRKISTSPFLSPSSDNHPLRSYPAYLFRK